MREASQRPNRSKARAGVESGESETTLHKLRTRGERLLQWFPELRKTWQRDAEPSLEVLLEQLQALGEKVGRRAQETGRGLEAGVERLLGELERQAVRGLEPLRARANLASHAELLTIDTRLQDLEARLTPLAQRHTELADCDTRLQAAVDGLRTALAEARAETSERLRELMMQLAAGNELQQDLGRMHEQLDVLSKEQVAKSLDIAKLHDRLVRLEMRMGDVVKEQATQVNTQQEVGRRLDGLDQLVAESTRLVQSAWSQVADATVAGRATDARLTALVAMRDGDHYELTRLGDILGNIHQTLRQVDLRLGDLGERYAAVRDELANLSARVSRLELAPTQVASGSLLTLGSEGH